MTSSSTNLIYSDFTILRTVSDVIQKLEAKDLLDEKGLVVLVLENLEVFEKLAPIIGITEEDDSPETYAKMMQYMGLVNRHDNAYREFARLLKAIKKWRKPYKSLVTIRETYPKDKYKVPQEFSDDVPGMEVSKRYDKYVDIFLES